MAHRRKYLAIVHFRVYRDLTICCWSLNIEGSSFLLSHPTPSEAAKPPKPSFLLSFEIVLKVRKAGPGQGRAGQGRQGGFLGWVRGVWPGGGAKEGAGD